MAETEALFLDARTRRDQEVRIELATNALRIHSMQDSVLTEWPYEKLKLVRRGTRSGTSMVGFVVGHEGNDISRLTVFKPEICDELRERSPKFKAQLVEGRFVRMLGQVLELIGARF